MTTTTRSTVVAEAFYSSIGRALSEAHHSLAFRVGERGELRELSQSALKAFGRCGEGLKGVSLFTLLAPEVQPAWRKALDDVLKDRRCVRVDLPVGDRWYDCHLSPDPAGGDGGLTVLVAGWDVTNRRQREDLLRSVGRQQTVVGETVPLGILHLKDRKVIWVNPGLGSILGYAPSEFPGRDTADFYARPADYQRVGKEGYRLMAAGCGYSTEALMKCKDGSQIWCALLGHAVDVHRPEDGSIWIIQDIHDRKQLEQDLRNQRDLLASVIEGTRVGTWRWNVQTGYVEFNERWAEIIGYTLAELAPVSIHTWTRLAHPDDLKVSEFVLKQHFARVVDYYDCECRMRHKDGSWVWVHDRGKLVSWTEDGRPEWMSGTHSDITQRKLSEAALRDSEASFRAFFETIGDLALVTTPQGGILFTNPSLERKLGYSADELASMHVLDLHPADSRAEAEAIFAAMLGGERSSCPLPLARKDGSVVPVETRVWFGRWHGRDCVFGLIKDISAEVEAQQRFERLFRHNPLLLAISTIPDRRFFDINDAFVRTLGFSREEVLGKTVAELELFPRQDKQNLASRALQADGRISDIDLQVRCKDGTIREGLFSGETILSQGQQYHLTVMVDVTERRRLEERLRESQKLEGIGHLAGGVAHEFNNILAAMMLNLSLVQLQQLGPELLESVGEMELLTERAADMIKRLLALSRQAVMKLQALDLGEFVSTFCDQRRPLLAPSITLDLSVEAGLPRINADRKMLEQVLFNLCSNGRDAMPKGGILRVRLTQLQVDRRTTSGAHEVAPGRYVCLSVADSGSGIDEATRRRLFEPFFTTKPVGQGSGLGLATVRGIVQQHHGWVEFESALGQGTVFRVYFPAMVEAPVVTHAPGPARKRRGPITILVVEDEPRIRGSTRKLFEQQGYAVLEAADGTEAWEIWGQQRDDIDVVHTDVVMPGGVTGLQLAERILADRPEVKVVVTSGYNAELLDRDRLPRLPVTYLAKPCPPATLLSVIRNLTSQ